MTTPLQTAAKTLLQIFHKTGNPIDAPMRELRKALEAEQSQAVEPVAWLVLDEDRIPIMCAPAKQMCNDHINDAINDFEITEASKWVVREAFTHPAPPPSATLTETLAAQGIKLRTEFEPKPRDPVPAVEPAGERVQKSKTVDKSKWVNDLQIKAVFENYDEAQQVAVPAGCVPMTPVEIIRAVRKVESIWNLIRQDDVTAFVRAIEAHHGITPQGDKP